MYKGPEVIKKGSLTIKPDQLEATSYDWWYLLKKVEGKIYLNTFKYSSTTSRHISLVRLWCLDHGIKPIEVSQPLGLLSEAVAR